MMGMNRCQRCGATLAGSDVKRWPEGYTPPSEALYHEIEEVSKGEDGHPWPYLSPCGPVIATGGRE